MQIDFTALEKIAPGSRSNKLPESLPDNSLFAEQAERQQIRKAYKEYQENIKRAGECRTELVKGIQQGNETKVLLLKAVECIGLMTGDRELLPQIKKDMSIVAGDIPPGTELHRLQLIKNNIEKAICKISDP